MGYRYISTAVKPYPRSFRWCHKRPTYFQAPWPPTCDLVHRRPPTTPSGGLLKPHKPKISWPCGFKSPPDGVVGGLRCTKRSEEHTSELQSRFDVVCRLLLE